MEAMETTKKTGTAKPGELKKTNVVLLTQMALLTAIIILMAYTPLGYLKIAVVDITFIVVPVAVGAVMLGGKAGAFLGLVFGLTSFAQAFSGANPVGALMLNTKPLAAAFCCIVPRIIVGIMPALVYHGMSKLCKKRVVNIAVSCVVAPLTNTILFVTCVAMLFEDTLRGYFSYTGEGGVVFLGWFFAMVAVNAIFEALACLLIGSAICNALWSVVKHRKN